MCGMNNVKNNTDSSEFCHADMLQIMVLQVMTLCGLIARYKYCVEGI